MMLTCKHRQGEGRIHLVAAQLAVLAWFPFYIRSAQSTCQTSDKKLVTLRTYLPRAITTFTVQQGLELRMYLNT
ncbi:hypothetical protein BDV98DRAFT_561995 [Pterulicium gracile]|uniref:Uncharacterized protein n=1 Tax=Pterulicium gracile TaxID=1884261 RepID=A0A5C3QXC5_9AGAR|nr:hypothetical protein BDV98DRAFT_561995 [Pterula gracilis]